jgi:hypothetical protein
MVDCRETGLGFRVLAFRVQDVKLIIWGSGLKSRV